MQPSNSDNNPPINVPQRQYQPLVSARPDPAAQANDPTQAAAANVARNQLENIYSNDPNHVISTPVDNQQTNLSNQPATEAFQSPTPTPVAHDIANDSTNPYNRTHDEGDLQTNPDAWNQYHSAWQNYYQQYFYRYYAGHVQAAHNAAAEQKARADAAMQNRPLSPEEAMDDIRSDLRGKIEFHAKKIRKSRHFVPILSGIAVILIFTFLQFNQIIFGYVEAYTSPGAINPSNVIVDSNADTIVTEDPLLIIPSISVEVPVVWDVKPDKESQDAAMVNGVAWFGVPGANSHPGQVGNTVLSGHSSNNISENGKYKFVFAKLEQLNEDDTIYINYKGTRYTYVVTGKTVVKPTDVKALIYDTNKPILTLVTCTPLGTSLNRLLVTAEQVSPSPSGAAPAPAATNATNTETPQLSGQVGNSVFQQIFKKLFGN